MQCDIACMIDPSIYVSIILSYPIYQLVSGSQKNKSNLSNTIGGGFTPTWGNGPTWRVNTFQRGSFNHQLEQFWSQKNADVLFPKPTFKLPRRPSNFPRQPPKHPRNPRNRRTCQAAEQAAEAERLRLEEVGRSGRSAGPRLGKKGPVLGVLEIQEQLPRCVWGFKL